MFISSTYWSDTLGLRAALTTLREVRRRRVPELIRDIGEQLRVGLNAAAREASLPVTCDGVSFHPHLTFHIDDVQLRNQAATLFIQEMAKRGCHGYASFYLNAAQGPAEIHQTLTAAREAFSIIARGLQSGDISHLLECDLRTDSFRRLVT
jgi:glutamate-1-semialdehyde aminotransferase